jgi:hypothetical protein
MGGGGGMILVLIYKSNLQMCERGVSTNANSWQYFSAGQAKKLKNLGRWGINRPQTNLLFF